MKRKKGKLINPAQLIFRKEAAVLCLLQFSILFSRGKQLVAIKKVTAFLALIHVNEFVFYIALGFVYSLAVFVITFPGI